MHKYRLISKKGEGTFSEVLKAQSVKNGQYVAIKCMKNHFQSIDQVNNLREIQALKRLNPHSNIVRLQEVLFDKGTGRLALVFELMDMNIYELIRGRKMYLSERRVRLYMYQLLKAMAHMHKNGIFHRDIKPENILIRDEKLKVADFGSCRGIYSKAPFTEYISTRWYRAPECLLTDGYYDYRMDIWGIGCVFFEIVALFPLFPGTNELDQIERIHTILGTPGSDLLSKFKKLSAHINFDFSKRKGSGIDSLIPHASKECIDLMKQLLSYDFEKRLTARQALLHPYFREMIETERQNRITSHQLNSAQHKAAKNFHIAAKQLHCVSSRGSSTTLGTDTPRSSKDESQVFLSHTISVPAFTKSIDITKRRHKRKNAKRKEIGLPTIMSHKNKNKLDIHHDKSSRYMNDDFDGLPIISKKMNLNPPRNGNVYMNTRFKKKRKKKIKYKY